MTKKRKIELPPDEPGLDEATRKRRVVLAEMQNMSSEELIQIAIDAGIYTKTGALTKRYRED